MKDVCSTKYGANESSRQVIPASTQVTHVSGSLALCGESELTVDLVWPAKEYLAGYVEALRQGWSPDNLRPEAVAEELAHIAEDTDGFIASKVDRGAKGPPIVLPDGSTVTRLPGYSMWMWDGEFCGSIGFRWQPGTAELPEYALGHVGYSVVPWKRRRGYATRALKLLLPYARAEGLAYVELTTDADNLVSQRVIEANGGRLVGRFFKSAAHGGAESLRFRISLSNVAT
jgi:predicted acetyltransferase